MTGAAAAAAAAAAAESPAAAEARAAEAAEQIRDRLDAAHDALAQALPQGWVIAPTGTTLVCFRLATCAEPSRLGAVGNCLMSRAVTFDVTTGAVLVQIAGRNFGAEPKCVCLRTFADKHKPDADGNSSARGCVCLSGQLAPFCAARGPSRGPGEAMHERWRRVLKMVDLAESCHGLRNAELQEAMRIDTTRAQNRNFCLETSCALDGSIFDGLFARDCALATYGEKAAAEIIRVKTTDGRTIEVTVRSTVTSSIRTRTASWAEARRSAPTRAWSLRSSGRSSGGPPRGEQALAPASPDSCGPRVMLYLSHHVPSSVYIYIYIYPRSISSRRPNVVDVASAEYDAHVGLECPPGAGSDLSTHELWAVHDQAALLVRPRACTEDGFKRRDVDGNGAAATR